MIRINDSKNYKRFSNVPGSRDVAVGLNIPRALYTAAGGETTLNLASLSPQLSYSPGTNTLKIQSSLGIFISGVDFYETSATTVSFPVALQANEVLDISVTAQFIGNTVAQNMPFINTFNNVTAGTTSFTCDFSFPYNLLPSQRIGGAKVYLNGVLQHRNANNAVGGDADYYEVNLSQPNTNQIVFNSALSGGENVTIEYANNPVDTTAASTLFNNTRIADMQEMFKDGMQGMVDETAMINVPFTTIVGRAQIPNIAADLKPSFGVERIQTIGSYQLQNEFGPNGEPVFGVVNDSRGLIRLYGSWTDQNTTAGPRILNSGAGTDYSEISFYGTGLNIICTPTTALDIRASVDGGVEGANIFGGVTYSPVLGSRNYSINGVVGVVSNLSLGIHTIKLRYITGALSGFEILNTNSTTNININQGHGYKNGSKLSLLANASSAYNSGFESGTLGTRGGRVLAYLKTDGTVAKAVQPTNGAAAYLASADHTNEEVVRTYHWREFGAGRGSNTGTPPNTNWTGDDFSVLGSTSGSAAFTLDDGTTTLVGSGVKALAEHVSCNATNDYIIITFIGTGLDIMCSNTNSNGDIYVDGTLQGQSGTSTGRVRIASGLPYGTHNVKFLRTVTGRTDIKQFIIYQPKTPSLPSGALELGAYNIMADYSVNASAAVEAIGNGRLRKINTREFIYVGTWAAGIQPLDIGGWQISSSTTNDYVQYTFFGTGIDIRTTGSGTSSTWQINLDGSTNLSSYSLVGDIYGGSFTSWTPSTGTFVSNATGGFGGIRLYGLTLGLHTIKITKTGGTGSQYFQAFEVITPIHSHKSNVYVDYQNTLTVGSNSLSDNRSTSLIKETNLQKKNFVQAVGIASGPTTTSTSLVPAPDMSAVIKTTGGDLKISYSAQVENNIAANWVGMAIFVNGVQVSSQKLAVSTSNAADNILSDIIRLPVAAGTHKVDLYWRVSANTGLLYSTSRVLLVEEV